MFHYAGQDEVGGVAGRGMEGEWEGEGKDGKKRRHGERRVNRKDKPQKIYMYPYIQV